MQRESTLGRVLWITVLVVLGGYVVSDFVRSPFLAPSGSAAVRPAELTLWVPGGDAGHETELVAREAAAGLFFEGHSVAVKSLSGGSSQVVARFLSHPRADGGDNLLVLSSATLADLARDRRDRLIPGAAEHAALAQQLLGRAVPLGILASEPLALAVASNSRIEDSTELLAAMRSRPGQRLFGIADDTWSRVQLAALVERAGVNGHIRFSVFQSGGEAAQALTTVGANTALATRGSLQEDARGGRLRELAWPFDGGHAPRAWTAVIGRPGLSRIDTARLREWIAALTANRRWKQLQRRAGRRPGGATGTRLARLLRAGSTEADRLELLSQRVERR